VGQRKAGLPEGIFFLPFFKGCHVQWGNEGGFSCNVQTVNKTQKSFIVNGIWDIK
jgi:predicted RecA/RadA family phage recombinase